MRKLRRFPPVRRIFNAIFLSAKTFRCFSGKRQSGSTRSIKTKKSRRQRKRRQLFTARFPSFVPICALSASIRDRRVNFRRFRLFGRILRAFTGALPQSRRSGLFKRVSAVLRVFMLPLKKFLAPLSSFNLSCFRRRTVSFLFWRPV